MPDVYRQAASILVLRPNPQGEGHQLLLLHKPRRNDAWQLPQGGIETGETVEQAALRELKEEAGLHGCRVLGLSSRVYQYDFPPSFRHFRPDNVKGQQISFVFALAPDAARVKVDDKEVDGHVWVTTEELPNYVDRKEYLHLASALATEAMALL